MTYDWKGCTKVKILVLVDSYTPMLNSAARLFSELAEGLYSMGYEVSVVTTVPDRYIDDTGKERCLKRREVIDGVKIYRMPHLSLSKKVPFFRAIEQFVYAFMYMVKALMIGPHDVVIVYSPPMPFGITGIVLSKLWKGISILNIQDLYPKSVVDLELLKSKFMIKLAEWLEQVIYKNSDIMTVHSYGNLEFVVGRGASPDKVKVVYNWIDLHKYNRSYVSDSFRSDHKLDKDTFLISYAGVMGFAQGVDNILRAAKILENKTRGSFLVLVGGGVELDKLKALSVELGLRRVLFLPHVPEKVYISLLIASDVCVVTLHDKLKTPVVPGKLACIMSVGRPVICSTPRESDSRTLLRESNAGFWIEAGDITMLTNTIVEVKNNLYLRKVLGHNGVCFSRMKFNKDQWIGCYDSLIKTRSKVP